ncbi:hypothetical protein LMH66_18040 [Shewanella sp. 10N.7]|uniref:hypothetical protein n=1 Tax=Shewanella sp. 10N.7 TaxID=2885093 RepID=UPI001E3D8622|nr:hypothetical protein [Shewanella sp. 10N.7]MCC4834551.1 hypothetical protein [Shewanella sp. 10N.7]
MNQSKIRLHKILIKLLKSKTLTQFSAIELKKMFIEELPGTKNKDASQIVHRALSKLCSVGFLEKQTDGKKVSFIKTSMFDESCFCTTVPRNSSPKTPVVNDCTPKLIKLKATLNQYQIDLLSHIGEAEEFKRLFNEFPETKANLYSRYMHARNQGSSMVGKIKAIEACIKTLES